MARSLKTGLPNPNASLGKAIIAKKPKKGFKVPTRIENAWEYQYTLLPNGKGGINHKWIVITEIGLEAIVRMAAQGKSKITIAYCLKLDTHQLETIMKRRHPDGEDEQADPSEKAWQLGRAMLEDHVANNLLRMSKTQVIAAIYVSKSMFHWRDNDPAPQQEGEKHVHIHLPESQDKESFFASFKMAHELQNATSSGLPASVAFSTTGSEPVTPSLPQPNWPPKESKP